DDGTVVDETLVSRRGHPLEPATAADVVTKAKALARNVLGEGELSRWLHLALESEPGTVSLRALMAATVRT
ncbi:MAG: hypothetical protein ACOCYE_13070, partial [Pseudomonadota bacterium]